MSLSIDKDKLVTLSVRMADMSGKVLEETGPEGLTYLHGHGDILPKLEKALETRFAGEGFFIKLEPEDAFGEYDADAMKMMSVRELSDDPDAIVPGLVFDGLPGDDADKRTWYVTDVAEGMAVLEANHPLAGMALQFEIKVLDVADVGDDVEDVDSVVVPSFLGLADKLVKEDDDEVSDEEMDAMISGQTDVDTPMARMAAKPVRIIR